MEVVMIRNCREYLTNVTPIILSLEEGGKTAREVKSWFEENNPDNTIQVDLYYIAIEKGLPNPMTLPLDELNLEEYIKDN
jgi:hypothetical protein